VPEDVRERLQRLRAPARGDDDRAHREREVDSSATKRARSGLHDDCVTRHKADVDEPAEADAIYGDTAELRGCVAQATEKDVLIERELSLEWHLRKLGVRPVALRATCVVLRYRGVVAEEDDLARVVARTHGYLRIYELTGLDKRRVRADGLKAHDCARAEDERRRKRARTLAGDDGVGVTDDVCREDARNDFAKAGMYGLGGAGERDGAAGRVRTVGDNEGFVGGGHGSGFCFVLLCMDHLAWIL
jgi:hypothetical protein